MQWSPILSIKRQLYPVNQEHWLFQVQVPLVYVVNLYKNYIETLNEVLSNLDTTGNSCTIESSQSRGVFFI